MPPRGRRTELDKQYDFRQGSELTRELGEEAAKRLDAAYKINKRDKLKNDLRSGLSCWHMQVMDNKIMDERAVADKALEDQTKAKNVTILACAYERGKGRSRNTKKARKLYQKAAMMGDTDAAKFLAGCCLRGVGGKADPAEAFRWYKVAYDAGDLGAGEGLEDARQEIAQQQPHAHGQRHPEREPALERAHPAGGVCGVIGHGGRDRLLSRGVQAGFREGTVTGPEVLKRLRADFF